LKQQPFGFDVLTEESRLATFDNHSVRKLSALKGYYADQAAFQSMVDAQDPVTYEVYEIQRPETAGELLHGLSVVHAGNVGGEYFMTKGHYHTARDTGEIYYCLKGRGYLLMENESGESTLGELRAGRVVYVTPFWAHRSINTGVTEDLVTLFAYPGHSGHDYHSIQERGFKNRVFDHKGVPRVVPNGVHTFSS
jgi:glucose-6-phosphate isomerase, archaeal